VLLCFRFNLFICLCIFKLSKILFNIVSSDLIINVSPSEVVIALQENKRLVELTREKSGAKFAVGDIYLGRVKKIMPSLNAAFIDVGYEKDAFLHYLDMGPQFSTLSKFMKFASSKKKQDFFPLENPVVTRH